MYLCAKEREEKGKIMARDGDTTTANGRAGSDAKLEKICFGVFRLRSGREIESYSLSPPFAPLPLLLMTCLRRKSRKRFYFSSPFLPQIFHLDLIPVLSLGDTIGRAPGSFDAGATISVAVTFFGALFTMIVKN